jgi:hypothetical protein
MLVIKVAKEEEKEVSCEICDQELLWNSKTEYSKLSLSPLFLTSEKLPL